MSTAARFCQRFCVGLTGGIASGKSTAASHFETLGALIIDTDAIAHTLTHVQNGAPGLALAAIAGVFGRHFLNTDGSLNRPLMRAHVFSQPAERLKLEAILHPMIAQRTHELAQQTHGEYTMFVVPLLVESPHWRHRVDRIAVVDCEPSIQLERLLKRPGMAAATAPQIMQAQTDRASRVRAADDLIHNQGTLADFLQQVTTLHARYCELAREARRA